MKEPMNSSAKRWQKLPWLLMFFFLSSTTFTLNSASSSATTLPSYKDHCASTIPESDQHSYQKASGGSFPLSRSHGGYYAGGSPLLNPKPDRYYWSSAASAFLNSMSFRTMAVYASTDSQDFFKVEGSLTFRGVNTESQGSSNRFGRQSHYSGRGDNRRNSMTFSLSGFWSESSGNLCMVGSGSTYSTEGNQLNLSAVLKLHNVTKKANITSLITGTIESLSSAGASDYFEPISILMLPQYTSLSADVSNGDSGGSDIPPGLSLSSLPPKTFCSIGYRADNQFNLKYSKGCNSTKICSPFDHAGTGYVPRVMSLYKIQCSKEDEKLRVLVEFPEGRYVSDSRSFNPNTTLVGEGSWDEKENQLFIVACRFLGTTESLANVHVGDCSTKLIFRYPKTWSINVSSNVLGKIWSSKTVNEAGYFDRIKLQSSGRRNGRFGVSAVSEVKYEYTKIEKAKKLCSDTKTIKGKGYPDAFSSKMQFSASIKQSKREIGWGYSEPLFVGQRFYEYLAFTASEVPANPSISPPVNISYRISLSLRPFGGGISPFNSSSHERWEILAEGIYDVETGSLCMVGCRDVGSDTQIPIDDPNKDCEILVKFQFPPLNSKNEGKFKGSITSKRDETDPLYFRTLDLSSYGQASVWRMDMEIIMVLISTTLSCVLVVLQLFHVKRHPGVLPLISLVTLSVLTLGNMIPLLLNFEALFFDNNGYRYEWFVRGGLLEANEVIVRVTGMIAFLLQFRLLQQTWSARWGDGNQKVLWIAEKKAVFVVLPLYVAGAFLALLVANWKEPAQQHQYYGGMISSGSIDYMQRYCWEGLKSYAGLVLDGFLLPQILLNMFRNSKENALSAPFYIGTTFVRVLPHAYDLYRAHKYARNYDASYIYANSGSDFYSTAWDVVIPLGGLLFVVIIYLQQRFGGRCILPRKYRELEVYEKVPVVSDA